MHGARLVVLVPDAAARDAVRSIASCDPIRDLQAAVSVAEAPMEVCVRETRRSLFDGPIAVLTWSEESARRAIAAGADEAFALESVELDVHAWFNLVERARLKHTLRREAAPHIAAIRELERLCALGRLVSGVAEELHDPLHSALLSLELLRLDLEPLYAGIDGLRKLARHDEPVAVAQLRDLIGPIRGTHETPFHARQILADVTEACEAIARVAEELGLTSASPELRELIDLRQMADKILRLFQRAVGKNTLIERDYAEQLPDVLAPRGRVAQVLISLLANALASLRGRTRERHRLRLSLRADEGAVRLTVSDTGAGIEPDLLQLIFDPAGCPSAAPSGETVGLELSVAREVMRSIGGDLQVATPEGKGASFVVSFTRPDDRMLAALAAPKKVGTIAPPEGIRAPARRSVLVLEPDRQVLDTLSPMLRTRYEVWTATDGSQARGLLRGKKPDAIVAASDDVDGLQFVEWVLRERPELTRRLLITTSHLEGDDLAGLCCVEKPLEPSVLFRGLEERFVAPLRKTKARRADPGRTAARW